MRDLEMRGRLMLLAVTWTALGAVFIISAAHHLVKFREFVDAITEHGVLPRGRRLAFVFMVFETLLGVGGALIGFSANPDNRFRTAVGGAMLLLLILLVAYVKVASTNASGVGCGCGPVGSYLGNAVLARNVVLVFICLAALSAQVAVAGTSSGVSEHHPWMVLPISIALALLVHIVPVGWSLVERERSRLLSEHTPIYM